MCGHQIAADEVVFRRIPPGKEWFEPPDRITTANFKLDRKRNELGLSVYRASIVTAAQVLTKPDALPGSLVAQATADAIRHLTNGVMAPLNLDVIAIDDDNDAGHSEIRGPQPGRLAPAASKALRDLFVLG